tara:strand:+ start:744 stop:1091 length:348 start_codon:yes stop_codon:yes gene_type:complete
MKDVKREEATFVHETSIPFPERVEMATDSEMFGVFIDLDDCKNLASYKKEDAFFIDRDWVIQTFERWQEVSEDARVNGYGKHSGKSLWQLPETLQRKVFKMCKSKAFEVHAYEEL